MEPINPFDRADWIASAHAQDMDQTQVRQHGTLPGCLFAIVVCVGLLAVAVAVIATVEIAGDLLRSGRAAL